MDWTLLGRVLAYLALVVVIPLGFAAIFYPLYHFRHEGLIEQFGGGRTEDAMALSAQWADVEGAITCAHCGAANGPEFTYCHTCQTQLPEDGWDL